MTRTHFHVFRVCALLAGLCCFLACQGQTPSIAFEVRSAYGLDFGEQVFITGNQPELGNWNPSSVPLQESGGVWKGEFAFPEGTRLEFKFTKGSWDSEAVTSEGRAPGNHVHLVRGDTVLSFVIPFWRDSVRNLAPHISGRYEIHEDFPVKGLAARRVIVWLPPSYDAETDKQYPVLYMHDGQNVFDPYTSSLGYDWRVDEIADSLIRSGEIAEFICVAVYCNPDVRGQEYSDDPILGEKYQDFMCCQLKPWVDSMYRTQTGPEHTAVMGASMGGLISFILAWEYPGVFGHAACMSPAFKFQQFGFNVDYVSDVESTSGRRDIELYIDNGTLEIEAILQPGIDEMMQVLEAKGSEFTWYLDAGAPHNEIAWSRRVWRPLKMFFGK